MIASVNQDTGECRLVRVYRDTYLNLSNDTYNKCNSAYAKGGPKMAMNMLNMNLDMNITDFVTVGLQGFGIPSMLWAAWRLRDRSGRSGI